MSDLFAVEGKSFIEALESKMIKDKQSISLVDIFETYVELAYQSTDAMTKDMLRSLIFKQFQKYGDFDAKVRQTAQTVSEIHETTGDVITAIEQENTANIKVAFDKLKVCSIRMKDLEDSFLIDEHTLLFNRKFLFTKILNDELKFKDDGILFLLQIDALEALETEYGPIITKSVIKKFAQSAKSAIVQIRTPLIHYEDNEFLILVDEKISHDIRSILKLLHRTFEVKKFKISDTKTLSFNFTFKESIFKKNQLFEGIYSKLLE